MADNTDCDDANPDVSPSAEEVCNDLDDDCDLLIDIADPGIAAPGWFLDEDLDGFGDPADVAISCEPIPGRINLAGDCDDTRDDINPAMLEYCNEVDDDCDGDVDEASAVDVGTYYLDSDQDGYGTPDAVVLSCSLPIDAALTSDDCDDGDENIHPGASETCDGADEDCDTLVDEEAIDGYTSFLDLDGDGFGDPATSLYSCDIPAGDRVADGTDCDDTMDDIFPTAVETCDGRDEDCDGDIDSPAPADSLVWFEDTDGDGFGNPAAAIAACDQPDGHVTDDQDCDDTNGAIHPDAVEVCNGYDDNCDLKLDGSEVPAFYPTIQSAIDGVTPGSTICVAPGTYNGPFNWGAKSLVLSSTGGSAVTTLDGRGLVDGVLSITGATASRVEGFTIANGHSTSDAGLVYGSGLRISAATVDLADVVVRDCECTNFSGGCGAYFNSSTVTWTGGEITGNVATGSDVGWGAGLYATLSTLTLTDVRVTDNAMDITLGSGAGAGLYVSGGVFVARDVEISDQLLEVSGSAYEVVSGTGAGAHIFADSIDIDGFTLLRNNLLGGLNSGLSGGGAYLLAYGDVDARNIVVMDNLAEGGDSADGGGLILVFGGTLSDIVAQDNAAISGSATGAGISFSSSAPALLERATVSGNVTEGRRISDGAGLAVRYGADVIVRQSTIADNRAEGTGIGNGRGAGAAVDSYLGSASMVCENVIFRATSLLAAAPMVALSPSYKAPTSPSSTPISWRIPRRPRLQKQGGVTCGLKRAT